MSLIDRLVTFAINSITQFSFNIAFAMSILLCLTPSALPSFKP